jgi:hypothetical protein
VRTRDKWTARRTARWGGLLAALALAAAWAAPALACPVCYGDASDPVLDGTKISIAFLGSLVYLLLFGGVGMAVMVRRRALRTMDPRHGLRLIEGSAEGGSPGEGGADGGTERDDSGRREPAAPQETSER